MSKQHLQASFQTGKRKLSVCCMKFLSYLLETFNPRRHLPWHHIQEQMVENQSVLGRWLWTTAGDFPHGGLCLLAQRQWRLWKTMLTPIRDKNTRLMLLPNFWFHNVFGKSTCTHKQFKFLVAQLVFCLRPELRLFLFTHCLRLDIRWSSVSLNNHICPTLNSIESNQSLVGLGIWFLQQVW